jgi:3-oxoacyl-[acyl-carrier protein] reductase
VNAVAPGFVDTALQDAVLEAGPLAGAQYDRVLRARENGEGTVPSECAAELTLFLASPASGSLTGKLVSAPHDPWREWAGRSEDMNASPLYTLRRLDPHTLGALERGSG